MNNCKIGTNCGASCIQASKTCRMISTIPGSAQANPVILAQGNYGTVTLTPQNTVIKTITDGGAFGQYESQLQKLMGDAGFSPKLIRATDTELEMDLAPGKPIWDGYRPAEGEMRKLPPTAQQTVSDALTYLHRQGFIHGDQHVKQWILDPTTNDVKLVDFGLSEPIANVRPRRAMIDLTKSSAFMDWDAINPEVGALITEYRQIKGTSQAAMAKQDEIGQRYLELINATPEV